MPGTVIVFNCMLQPLTILRINMESVLNGPVPAITASGASTLSIPRGTGTGQFSDTSKVAVGFGGANASWIEWISVPASAKPWDTLYLWVYINAYVFCGADGVVHGTYLQSLSATFEGASAKSDSEAQDPSERRNEK